MVVVAGLVATTAAMAVVVDETRPGDDGGRRARWEASGLEGDERMLWMAAL